MLIAGIEEIPRDVAGVERTEEMIAAAGGLNHGQCAGGRIEPDLDIVIESVVGAEREKLAAQVFDQFLLGGLGQRVCCFRHGLRSFWVPRRLCGFCCFCRLALRRLSGFRWLLRLLSQLRQRSPRIAHRFPHSLLGTRR